MAPLRVGAFLSSQLLPFYETAVAAAAAALGREPELVVGALFSELADAGLDAAILCGLPYVDLRDRSKGIDALVAPAASGDRYHDEAVYFSDVIARRGGGETRLEDFAGRTLAVNEPDSHSGYNIVAGTLQQRGVPVGRFAEVKVSGGHADSVAAVRAGAADVAAVDAHLLAVLGDEDPGVDAELTVVESLGPSPSQPFAAGPALDGPSRAAVTMALTTLPPADLAPGLEGVRWLAVDDSAYGPVREMRAAARIRGGF